MISAKDFRKRVINMQEGVLILFTSNEPYSLRVNIDGLFEESFFYNVGYFMTWQYGGEDGDEAILCLRKEFTSYSEDPPLKSITITPLVDLSDEDRKLCNPCLDQFIRALRNRHRFITETLDAWIERNPYYKE